MSDIQTYIDQIDPKWQEAYIKLDHVIAQHISAGFSHVMQYKMPSYVVPFDLYSPGYHVDPSLPLPFLALGVQKHHIGLYHMGIYSDPQLLKWFQDQYAKDVSSKLNMGKSCIRFTNPNKIPYDLIGELVEKMTPQDWIARYQENLIKA